MFQQIFSSAVINRINSAIARDGRNQVKLNVNDGDSSVSISFLDVPFISLGETFHVCAWAFHDEPGGKSMFEVLVKPDPSSTQCIIFSSEPPYESGEDAYKMFSYAAICYAHENNWRFPTSFPENTIHPELRPR